MHYPVLKILMKLAMRLYFRRIVCSGLEEIEHGKPVLILANHTNGFLDALVVGAVARRKPYFFTRGDAFKKKRADRFLRSIGLLPVYRLSEGKDNLQHNDSTNEEALNIFEQGGIVVIYPEGKSDVAKVVKPLKKGPFRLAVHAAGVVKTAPVIIPLGINYTHPVRPFTTLYLQAGPAIDLAACKGLDEKDQAKMALQLMRQLTTILPEYAWDVKNETDILLADDLLALQELHDPSFAQTKQLVHKLNSMEEPARADLHCKWQRYRELQQILHFSNEDNTWRLKVQDVIAGILGSVPALAGWAFHWLPVYWSKRLADKLVRDADLYASVFLSGSLLFVVGWYLLLMPLIALLCGWQVMLACLVALPVAGSFHLKIYRVIFRRLKSYLHYKRMLGKSPAAVQEYRELREKLLSGL